MGSGFFIHINISMNDEFVWDELESNLARAKDLSNLFINIQSREMKSCVMIKKNPIKTMELT